jgi:type II restriction enzyme
MKSQSDKLRENKNQHSQKNTLSQDQDVKISKVVKQIQKDLSTKYNITINSIDQLPTQELEKMVSSEITTKESTYIKPDGGFLYITVNGQRKFILVSEQKRQGTNDQRLLENKGTQSKGNAVERLGKNIKGIDILFKDEDIYPFICFLQGCDFFDQESTITDRVRTIACFQKMNQINLNWMQLGRHLFTGGSFFMRGHSMNELVNAKNENREPQLSDWSYQEMYDAMYEIADRSIQHYLNQQ